MRKVLIYHWVEDHHVEYLKSKFPDCDFKVCNKRGYGKANKWMQMF